MTPNSPNSASIDELANRLKDRLNINVLVAAGCPNCPHMVNAANQLAAEIPLVSVDVFDASEVPDLADRYQVRSVPTTVVNEGLTIIGVVTRDELAGRILESLGPAGDDAIFESLIQSGRIADATAYLVEGRGLPGFAGLWNGSALEARIGLSLVAQNAIDEAPACLDGLVDLVLPSLGGENTALRGDTADLLGVIAHESARPALEKLLGDNNDEIAEAAQDAIDCINERAEVTDSD